MSERFWMLIAAAVVVVVVVFSVWYFVTSRTTRIQPANPTVKPESYWREFYQQKIRSAPPGQYQVPQKPAP